MTYRRRFTNPTFTATGDIGVWQTRHLTALRCPDSGERPIVDLLEGWAAYADHHRARYDSGIGEDGVLGPAWASIGRDMRMLLNGELGRLDGGTLDAFLYQTLAAEGFDPDML